MEENELNDLKKKLEEISMQMNKEKPIETAQDGQTVPIKIMAMEVIKKLQQIEQIIVTSIVLLWATTLISFINQGYGFIPLLGGTALLAYFFKQNKQESTYLNQKYFQNPSQGRF
jgi:hypothetical protein